MIPFILSIVGGYLIGDSIGEDIDKKIPEFADGGEVSEHLIHNFTSFDKWKLMPDKRYYRKFFVSKEDAKSGKYRDFADLGVVESMEENLTGDRYILILSVSEAGKDYFEKNTNFADGGMTKSYRVVDTDEIVKVDDEYSYGIEKVKMYRLDKNKEKIYFDSWSGHIYKDGEPIVIMGIYDYDEKEELKNNCLKAIKKLKEGTYKGYNLFADGGMMANGGGIKPIKTTKLDIVKRNITQLVDFYDKHNLMDVLPEDAWLQILKIEDAAGISKHHFDYTKYNREQRLGIVREAINKLSGMIDKIIPNKEILSSDYFESIGYSDMPENFRDTVEYFIENIKEASE